MDARPPSWPMRYAVALILQRREQTVMAMPLAQYIKLHSRAAGSMASASQATQAPRVRGTPVPQLSEALDEEDDWSGVTDAASRRRLQNRLNVRAWRRRRALQFKQQEAAGAEPTVPFWNEKEQTIRLLPSSKASKINNSRSPLIPLQPSSHSVLSRRPQSSVTFPLSSDHLIILLQFNDLRACLANRELVAPLGSTPVAECASAAEHVLAYPSDSGVVPPSLLPTSLQCTIPHEGWLDIIPHPVWRDNVLLALGHFDEDALWSDVMGGLFEGFPESEVEHRGVIAWSPPWDPSGWELSEGFASLPDHADCFVKSL
ncbi:hypothetical protein NM208_g5099 [Fusarium decemcellulare]|uniref:Uncharacterized protein n=1 Tax=Fusarium decemcellulare TaxID=57161 RepID=A0ACC1SI97_9HYPO|nr:hypothetical protein NM208_g5099 [Fusarium decemcellulare]